jgi:hypothetical protein
MAAENPIQQAILAAIGTRPDLRAWRNNSGALKDVNGRLVRFGLTGSADILGIMVGGRFLAIEVKAPGEDLSPQQRKFRETILMFGGLHVVARSVEDAIKALPPLPA